MDHWIWTFYPCEPWGLYIIITRGDLLAMYDHMSFTFLRSAYACSLHASSLCCYPINCFFAVDILGFHSHTCVYWPCMPSSCHTNGSIITSLVMVSVNYLGGVTLNVSSPFSGVVISGAHFYYISPLVWHVAIDGYRIWLRLFCWARNLNLRVSMWSRGPDVIGGAGREERTGRHRSRRSRLRS